MGRPLGERPLIQRSLIQRLRPQSALALGWGQPAEIVTEANQIYVFERLPHHLAPLTLPVGEFLNRSLRHGALIFGLWVLAGINRRRDSNGDASAGLRVVRSRTLQ